MRGIVIVADTVTEKETEQKKRIVDMIMLGEVKPTGAEVDFYCDREGCKRAFPAPKGAVSWHEHQWAIHGGPLYKR